MEDMFYYAEIFNQDMGKWNTSQVRDALLPPQIPDCQLSLLLTENFSIVKHIFHVGNLFSNKRREKSIDSQ